MVRSSVYCLNGHKFDVTETGNEILERMIELGKHNVERGFIIVHDVDGLEIHINMDHFTAIEEWR